jgi:NADPH-dependent ferric siderophore reductase
LRVLRTERITPHMIRVVAGGPGLESFAGNDFTDAYVKLLFPPAGVSYPQPLDVAAVRETFPREQWPVTRTYTIRYLDRAAGELAIDFVHHGDTGLAGPWAASVRPGEEFSFLGPGGAYAPDPAADWHLLAGDEAALPAISAAVEHLPGGARAIAIVEVEDPAEEQKLVGPGMVDVRWVHRADGGSFVDAVRALEFPAGTPHVFVHGETGAVKVLRRHLFEERGLSKEQVSISGYWRRGMNEDAFQESKRTDGA